MATKPKSFSVLLVFVLFIHGCHGSGCEPGWQNWQSYCYTISVAMGAIQQPAASTACRALGSDLASVWSHDEWQFIHQAVTDTMLAEGLPLLGNIWLGLHRVDGQFLWTDGSDMLDFSAWRSGLGGSGDCVTMAVSDGSWEKVGCEEYSTGYVCKKALLTFLQAGIQDVTQYQAQGMFSRLSDNVLPTNTSLLFTHQSQRATTCAMLCVQHHHCHLVVMGCHVASKCSSRLCTFYSVP